MRFPITFNGCPCRSQTETQDDITTLAVCTMPAVVTGLALALALAVLVRVSNYGA